MGPPPRVMLSVAEKSYSLAEEELRRALGRALKIERLGPDIGVIDRADVTIGEVAARCSDRKIVFVRHLSTEMARRPKQACCDLQDSVAWVCSEIRDRIPPQDVAVQIWESGQPEIPYKSGVLYAKVATELTRLGFEVSRHGQDTVVSICITPRGISMGIADRRFCLADWPGGRMRLAKTPDLVSRAELKLEELLELSAVALPTSGLALDLGASPGGWTRIVRRLGPQVIAVDPAELDPRVARDSGVRHVRAHASTFLREMDERLDLVVNDMRLEALTSCQVMLDVAPHLRRGAWAVVTLKLGHSGQLGTVHRSLATLARAYELVFVRQLHHNRNEVTVLGKRRAGLKPVRDREPRQRRFRP